MQIGKKDTFGQSKFTLGLAVARPHESVAPVANDPGKQFILPFISLGNSVIKIDSTGVTFVNNVPAASDATTVWHVAVNG